MLGKFSSLSGKTHVNLDKAQYLDQNAALAILTLVEAKQVAIDAYNRHRNLTTKKGDRQR